MVDGETLLRWAKFVQGAVAVTFALSMIAAMGMFDRGNPSLGVPLLVVTLVLGTVTFASFTVQSLYREKYKDVVGFGAVSVGIVAAGAHVWTRGAVLAATPLTIAAGVGIIGGMLVATWGHSGGSWVPTPFDP